MRIGLVACSLAKYAGVCQAQDAYLSRTFIARKEYVQKTCDSWYILSSQYGLLHPTAMIRPYDVWLRHKPIAERKAWQTKVRDAVVALRPTAVEIHAGLHYYEPVLERDLLRAKIMVDIPTRGLTITRTYAWLKGQLQ